MNSAWIWIPLCVVAAAVGGVTGAILFGVWREWSGARTGKGSRGLWEAFGKSARRVWWVAGVIGTGCTTVGTVVLADLRDWGMVMVGGFVLARGGGLVR